MISEIILCDQTATPSKVVPGARKKFQHDYKAPALYDALAYQLIILTITIATALNVCIKNSGIPQTMSGHGSRLATRIQSFTKYVHVTKFSVKTLTVLVVSMSAAWCYIIEVQSKLLYYVFIKHWVIQSISCIFSDTYVPDQPYGRQVPRLEFWTKSKH